MTFDTTICHHNPIETSGTEEEGSEAAVAVMYVSSINGGQIASSGSVLSGVASQVVALDTVMTQLESLNDLILNGGLVSVSTPITDILTSLTIDAKSNLRGHSGCLLLLPTSIATESINETGQLKLLMA